MKRFLILFLAIVAGCTTTAPHIEVPAIEYKQSGTKIPLDVASIQVITEYQASPATKTKVIPQTIVPAIQEWAQTRFVATGTQGTAFIKIVNAGINEQNIRPAEKVNMLLNSDEKPMEYGVNVEVVVEVQDSPVYKEGKINTFLSRHITMDSDVLLGFNPQIWEEFTNKLINSLDRQVQVDLNTYLPKLLNGLNSSAVGTNA